ncbi:MAG TPA: hypothetical protein VK974_05055 [Methylophilaceae bacterium]|nr:hypothetical protein [Methylophilaceae bacterium]
MKIQKLMSAMIMLATLSAGSFAHAAEDAPSANMLVYIHPQEYNNSIKLWQYYKDYWYMQGPLVEAEAKQTLGAEFGDIGMCDENQTAGKALVWLRPRMFYNPQVQTYYGSITAVAYNANGKPIATYKGEAEKMGYLDVYPEKQIMTVYKQAMQAVASKMKADANLQAVLSDTKVSNEAKTPCSMVTLLPAPKIQFMSF